MPRGPRASCGKAVHGKEAADGGLSLCFACNRPGSRDGCSRKWNHVGDTEYWEELGEWSASVGAGWRHARDLLQDPLGVGECICARQDCVAGMYNVFKWHRRKQESGGSKMELGQPSPMGRYPSTHSQVRALLRHVEMAGGVLDCYGGTNDAVSTVLTDHGFRVTTNDFDAKLVADSHMDATTDTFGDTFCDEERRPEWVVTSPPYKHPSRF